MKDIKRRIKSVESTGQITKAMELVASAKLRRAKERAQNAAPFFSTLYETISDISSSVKDLSSEYVKSRPVKNSLLVVIAGDRGLAGGYNANIFKLANAATEQRKENGIGTKIIAVGKKAVDYYEKRNMMVAGFAGVAEEIDQIRVGRIAEIATELYQNGEVDEIILFYTRFASALSQVATEMKLLPLQDLSASEKKQSALEDCIYEPSPAVVFDSIVPLYLSGILYGSIVESFASEQGARRAAMESANDNAQEMIESLSLKYNRARQAAITQEISEIVSGAGNL